MFPCGTDQCEEVFDNLRDFINHIRRMHFLRWRVPRKCVIEACVSQLTSADSLRTHVMRYHEQLWREHCNGQHSRSSSNVVAAQVNVEEAYGDSANQHFQFSDAEDDVDEFCPKLVGRRQFEGMMMKFRKVLPSMFLRLQYQHNIPASVSRLIHGEYTNLFKLFRKEWSTALTSYMSFESELGDSTFRTMLECSEMDYVCSTSTYGEEAAFRRLGYVAPVEVDLSAEEGNLVGVRNPLDDFNLDMDDIEAVAVDSESEDEEGGSGDRDPVGDSLGTDGGPGNVSDGSDRKEVYHYVPILETLKSYLKHDDVVADIMRAGPTHGGDGYYGDFTSGIIYSKTQRFREDPHHLRIGLYTDEVTITNPLGAHSKIHKLAVVYFAINNLSPRNLSALQSIHLVLACKWLLVQKYSYSIVLKKLLNDLRKLQHDGIEVTTTSGQVIHFKGSLCFVSSDNLSAHALGGFRCSFSSGKMCRFCYVDYVNLRNVRCTADCSLRAQNSVAQQANLINVDPDLANKVYGLKSKSCLSVLDGYDPIFCLPPDVMHDILECFMPTHVRELLKALHRTKVLKFEDVLDALTSFHYGPSDSKNKHPGLATDWMTKKKKIGGSAAQKWALFRLLPFVIGRQIPEGNIHWELFLLGLQISEIVLALRVTDAGITELDVLIKEHHDKWVELYPGTFPAKFHYLVHYPRLMQHFGPLRLLWCMRFESFHQFLKQILARGRNFINETKTACERFQKRRCLEYDKGRGLPEDMSLLSSARTIRLQDVQPVHAKDCILDYLDCPANVVLRTVTKISVKGITVVVGCYNILRLGLDVAPLLFTPTQIFVCNETVILYGRHVAPDHFDDHLQAFALPNTDISDEDFVAITTDDLVCTQTLSEYHVGGSRYVRYCFRPF